MLVFVERSTLFGSTLAGVILGENALSLKATAKFGSMTRKMLAICCFHHISWTLSPEISLLTKKNRIDKYNVVGCFLSSKFCFAWILTLESSSFHDQNAFL